MCLSYSDRKDNKNVLVFRRALLLDQEIVNWLFSTFAWSLENFGSEVFYKETELITPTNKYFPDKADSADSMVKNTFARVRKYAGLESWPCHIQPQTGDPNPIVGPTLVLKGAPSSPLGTFSYRGKIEEAVITYNPKLIKNPESLVATFAHELAHYLSSMAKDDPPGGEEYWEYATDLIAVYLGFGIFMANSAFSFEQYSSVVVHGWSVARRGYLSEYQLTFALTIFCTLKDIKNDAVLPYLDRHLRSFYKKAVKEVLLSEHYSVVKSVDTK